MKTEDDNQPASSEEKEPKLLPDVAFGESSGGDEERPPDVVVEN